MLFRRWLLLLVLLSVPSCYSLMLRQEKTHMVSVGSTEVLAVSYYRLVGYETGVSGGEGNALGAIAVGILVWPFDVIQSSFTAARAVFNPKWDVWMGPLGAMGGILLPGVTLMTPIFPSDRSGFIITIDSEQFQSIVNAVRNGKEDTVLKAVEHQLGEGAQDVTMKIVDLETLRSLGFDSTGSDDQ